jgi:hypothetical protein
MMAANDLSENFFLAPPLDRRLVITEQLAQDQVIIGAEPIG